MTLISVRTRIQHVSLLYSWPTTLISVSAVKAYRYYRTALICAEEMSDELCYEENERYFNVETYVRWYEAIEKAVVIWLYYLGIRIDPVIRRGLVQRNHGRVHRYHEAFLDTLAYPGNPFFETFSRPGLLDDLRGDKKLRNQLRHGWRPVWDLRGIWEHLVAFLSIVNDVLEDTLNTFTQIWVGIL